MGVAKTLATGGLSNTEILTGVVMPKDFIKAPESVMSAVTTPKVTYEQQAASTLSPPPPQQPLDSAAGTERAAAQNQQQRQRSAFGTTSLIGD